MFDHKAVQSKTSLFKKTPNWEKRVLKYLKRGFIPLLDFKHNKLTINLDNDSILEESDPDSESDSDFEVVVTKIKRNN